MREKYEWKKRERKLGARYERKYNCEDDEREIRVRLKKRVKVKKRKYQRLMKEKVTVKINAKEKWVRENREKYWKNKWK